MTNEDNLEHRLRTGLQHAAPTSVVDRPGVDELASVVAGRKRRNKVAGVAFAAVGGLTILGGGLIAALPDDSPTEVVLAAPDEDATPAEQPTAATEEQLDAPEEAAPQETAVDDAAAPAEEKDAAADAPLVSAPVEETIENAPLQVDASGISVETQASAVEFAGGSGVLLVPTADGFAGLASRFGGAAGIAAIGLESTDGLDWSEVDLAGVPAGATATALREFDGTFVALFSQFDVDAQRNNTFVGVSTDLASWSLAPALEGDAIATDLAVGPSGVIVVGVSPEPRVWVGPVGGPYQLGDSVDAATVAGVVAIDAGFVAVGTTPDGPTLFDSADGTEWTSSLMSGFDGDSVVSFTVLDGAILLAGDDGTTTWTAMSADGGQSWQRSDLEAGTVGSVSTGGGTVGMLGSSTLGANTLTLSDGDTWASTSIDVAAPDRLELLVAGGDAAVLLANIDGQLTWIRASR